MVLRARHLRVCIAISCVELYGLGEIGWIVAHLLLLSGCIVRGSRGLSLLLVAVLLRGASASSEIRGG